ncbi:Zinc/iron permease [Phlegmacium glaucopus]|nr:Zinc/iron permease [Phlegmacium glaucopus]
MAIMLFVMITVLGTSTFAVGMLPLLYAFSKSHLDRLSALGTGLLLGAALGVIIPEGLEVMAAAHTDGLPTGRIALCLVIGFILMLIIEQLISPHSHSHSSNNSIPALPKNMPLHSSTSEVEFDAELGDLGLEPPSDRRLNPPSTPSVLEASADRERAFALLLGLVIHGVADGLALGIALVAGSSTEGTNALSLVVFFALIIHKAPTCLAFTTSIISTNIPRPQCKKYLAIFSLSTPLSTLVTYVICSSLESGKSDLSGLALLVSGGTFLYVATVLQPVSRQSPVAGEMRAMTRVSITVLGMFIPLILRALFNHEH